MNIIFALIIFSIIVTIHELGHFIFAKLNDIEVLEFSIGMGPRLFKYQYKDTLYSIKLLPLGGSCRMLGEDDIEEDKIDPERQKRSFSSKPLGARFMVVFAGPLFNFILAFFLSIFVIYNVGIDKPVIGQTIDNFPASIAGIKEGDIIVKVNGHNINILRDYILYTSLNKSDKYELEIKRFENNKYQKYTYNLEAKQDEESGRKLLGIVWKNNHFKTKNIFETLKYSLYEIIFNIKTTLLGLKSLFTGLIGLDQISGPVGIVNFVGETINTSKSYGFRVLLLSICNLMILLSANLGVMNLLPIPALDGGRIAFYIVEFLTRKRVNKNIEAYVHIAGFVFLMLLMVFVIFNDIIKIIK